MTLLEMSFAGGVMILAVLLLRCLLFHRLPKRVLPALWALVLCRLLLPFSWPEAWSAYSVPAGPVESVRLAEQELDRPALGTEHKPGFPQISGTGGESPDPWPEVSLGQAVWAAGALGLALSFAWRCRKARRLFRESVPVEHQAARQWLEQHPLRRSVALRQIDRVDSPLTYGLLHPVILLPASMDLRDSQQLEAALAHEWTHIRRLDGLTKLLLAAALCLHWFNPLVWLFHWLNNRDLELACDEGAVQLLGLPRRGAYARALVDLEQARQTPPLCSPFSKSPLETRIRAIVRMKKPTWRAWVAAGLCLLALTLCFGSAAREGQQEALQAAPLTQAEREALAALQDPSYEQMTVADFRQQALAQMDGQGWNRMIERLWLDESLCAYQQSDREVAFLCQTLVPLTAEQWQTRDFSGGTASDLPAPQENASLEYVLILDITDEKALTVRQYQQAQREAAAALEHLLEGKTQQQLADEPAMLALIEEEISRLQAEYDGHGLELFIDYQYLPPMLPDPGEVEDRRQQWQQVLAPYLPFGVTFQYDQEADSFRLYFQGEEVRGIYDTQQGVWITEHTGDGLYAQDAPELYAVYQEGRLTGLRRATEQEQRQFDQLRYQNSRSAGLTEELRQYPPGTEQDYQSLLALQTLDYRRQTLAAFNQRLLAWAEQDFDRSQRVMTDISSRDFRVALTPEQRQFVGLTCDLSTEENFRQIQSKQRGKPALDPQYGGFQLEKQQGQAMVDLWLEFTYHVAGPEELTVGQRDDQVGGFLQDVQAFWDGKTLNELAQYTRGQMLEQLKQLAARRSSQGLQIQIEEDLIGFEMVKWS